VWLSTGRGQLGPVWSQAWFTSKDITYQAVSADIKPPVVRERGTYMLMGDWSSFKICDYLFCGLLYSSIII
jgi:hypothetical protein